MDAHVSAAIATNRLTTVASPDGSELSVGVYVPLGKDDLGHSLNFSIGCDFKRPVASTSQSFDLTRLRAVSSTGIGEPIQGNGTGDLQIVPYAQPKSKLTHRFDVLLESVLLILKGFSHSTWAQKVTEVASTKPYNKISTLQTDAQSDGDADVAHNAKDLLANVSHAKTFVKLYREHKISTSKFSRLVALHEHADAVLKMCISNNLATSASFRLFVYKCFCCHCVGNFQLLSSEPALPPALSQVVKSGMVDDLLQMRDSPVNKISPQIWRHTCIIFRSTVLLNGVHS